jgi:hypothetical protein
MGHKEPDLTKIAKTLTSKRLACSEEIRVLMDCMAVSGHMTLLVV